MYSFRILIDPFIAVILLLLGEKKNIIWLHKHLFHRLACFTGRNFLLTPWVNFISVHPVPGSRKFSFMGKLNELQIASGVAENAK